MRAVECPVLVCSCVLLVASSGGVFGWSLLDEVTILDPSLTKQVVWENHDVKSYCDPPPPPNLDRLECEIELATEFWFGIDSAGNRYGTINVTDATGDFFDIYRRPAGGNGNEHIVRVTSRTEPAAGEVTKLFVTGRWTLDIAQGNLLLTLMGSCFDAQCLGENDTNDHLALIKISGLPPLADLFLSYDPGNMLSFRIPGVPEGLPSGDFFDVYAGAVSSLPDLSTAQPLACDVAAGMDPGEVVQVLDTLADPPEAEARYYVAAVSSGTERRAGRQRINGVLTGRDATSLSPCQ